MKAIYIAYTAFFGNHVSLTLKRFDVHGLQPKGREIGCQHLMVEPQGFGAEHNWFTIFITGKAQPWVPLPKAVPNTSNALPSWSQYELPTPTTG
jgi:hypothetical protein